MELQGGIRADDLTACMDDRLIATSTDFRAACRFRRNARLRSCTRKSRQEAFRYQRLQVARGHSWPLKRYMSLGGIIWRDSERFRCKWAHLWLRCRRTGSLTLLVNYRCGPAGIAVVPPAGNFR